MLCTRRHTFAPGKMLDPRKGAKRPLMAIEQGREVLEPLAPERPQRHRFGWPHVRLRCDLVKRSILHECPPIKPRRAARRVSAEPPRHEESSRIDSGRSRTGAQELTPNEVERMQEVLMSDKRLDLVFLKTAPDVCRRQMKLSRSIGSRNQVPRAIFSGATETGSK